MLAPRRRCCLEGCTPHNSYRNTLENIWEMHLIIWQIQIQWGGMLFTLGSAKTLHILEKVTAQPTAAGIGLPIYMKASNSPSIDQPNTATAPVLLFLKLHFWIKVIGRLQTLLQKKVPQLRCRCRCVVFSASVKVLPECHLHGRMYDYVCQQEADKISWYLALLLFSPLLLQSGVISRLRSKIAQFLIEIQPGLIS